MPAAHELVAFGPVEEDARKQLDRCLDAGGEEARGVLCADHHKGYSMPIGGVLPSQSVVCPPASATTSRAGTARSAVFDAIAHSPVPQQRALLDLARSQLGTVGSGNHYVDLLEDRADGRLWVGVHFGSRGFGHKTASGFLALASGRKWGDHVNDSMDAPPSTIQLGTPMADDYLAAMNIAGEYAYAGRDWVVNRVLRLLGARDERRVHNHHNFAWWEQHDGRTGSWSARAPRPHFQGSLVSSADPWATMR